MLLLVTWLLVSSTKLEYAVLGGPGTKTNGVFKDVEENCAVADAV